MRIWGTVTTKNSFISDVKLQIKTPSGGSRSSKE